MCERDDWDISDDLVFVHAMSEKQAAVRTQAANDVDGVDFKTQEQAGFGRVVGQTVAESPEALDEYVAIVEDLYFRPNRKRRGKRKN